MKLTCQTESMWFWLAQSVEHWTSIKRHSPERYPRIVGSNPSRILICLKYFSFYSPCPSAPSHFVCSLTSQLLPYLLLPLWGMSPCPFCSQVLPSCLFPACLDCLRSHKHWYLLKVQRTLPLVFCRNLCLYTWLTSTEFFMFRSTDLS